MDVKPVEKQKVYQTIIRQLVDLIGKGSLKTGERLPAERELSEMFNVSRPSLREALRVLEILGLVEIKPGGGSYITDLNIFPFLKIIAPLFLERGGRGMELLELRYMLENRAVELAAEKRGPGRKEKMARIDAALDAMERALAEDNPERGAEADILFHRTIFEMTEHYVLTKAGEFVTSLLEISIPYARNIVLKEPGNSAELLRQHRAIADAVKRRDPEEAKNRMEEHMDFVRELYKR